MWRKRKSQAQETPAPAQEESASYADWMVRFREEQRRKEEEEWAASQELSDAERRAAEIQAILNQQENAKNYAAMVSNIMNMKHQTAQKIIGNMR